jgi:hypothetical protein
VVPVIGIARILPAVIGTASASLTVAAVCAIICHSLIPSFEIAVYSLPVNGTPAVSCCYR